MGALSELARLDGVAQAELVARGEASRAELLEGFRERHEALNPLIRAVPAVDLERARTAEVGAGPFAGVPFLMKDASPFPGLRWAMGSRLLAGNVASAGTPYSARIERSGLVTVGTSACSELGLLASTETLLDGPTHNPWDLSRSAAGSSGGAAAAVAAGIVPLAHGSDAGGSIRFPASACGLFGFKPSRGRCAAATLPSDLGALVGDHCLSRSVRDSALLLSLTEEPGTALPPAGHVRGPGPTRLRIATWARSLTGEEPSAPVRRAWEEAARLCASLGHRVEPVEPPDVDGQALGDALFVVLGASLVGLIESIDRRRGRPVQRDELEPFTWSVAEAYAEAGPGALEEARAVFAATSSRYLEVLEAHDAALTPTLPVVPWRLGYLSPILPRVELRARIGRSLGCAPLDNVAGCPAMSVPLHWTADGLPIGSHFAAAPGKDRLLLELAYELELARPWADRWAPWSCPRLLGG